MPCQIVNVGTNRRGTPRWWCIAHRANATGPHGSKLPECRSSHSANSSDAAHPSIDPEDYAGGIALWGVVDPVYDTTNLPRETGVHLHARRQSISGEKEIDGSYPAITLLLRRDLLDTKSVTITAETAMSLYISRFLKNNITCLFCTHCGEPHLDSDFFAVKPHKKHLCLACGKYFHDTQKSVSNPIVGLPVLGVFDLTSRSVKHSERKLNIRQTDYLGGIQIWASNPALYWTADRPEEHGLHVHLYNGISNTPVEDETFGTVTIDGHPLDDDMIRHLMAQCSLPYLAGKVAAIDCPKCGAPHFDRGRCGFYPHNCHHCDNCNTDFSSPAGRLTVSNPAKALLERLAMNAPRNRREGI